MKGLIMTINPVYVARGENPTPKQCAIARGNLAKGLREKGYSQDYIDRAIDNSHLELWQSGEVNVVVATNNIG